MTLMEPLPILVFRRRDTSYGVDSLRVRTIVWLPRLTYVSSHGILGAFNLRGTTVPVIDPRPSNDPLKPDQRIVVLDVAGRLVGWLVDDVVDVWNMRPGTVDDSPQAKENRWLAGIARFEDALVQILEPERIVNDVWSGEESLPMGAATVPGLDDEVYRERAAGLAQLQTVEDRTSLTAMAVITIGGERFAIDLARVVEFGDLEEIAWVPGCPSHVLGCVNHRGDILSVIDIAEILGLPSPQRVSAADQMMVIASDGVEAAVVIESIDDIIDVAGFKIGSVPYGGERRGREFLKGTYPYGDNMVGILDIATLIQDGNLVVGRAAS